MTHKMIIGGVMEQLSEERASYFSDIVNCIEDDPRTGTMSNVVYLVLRETIRILPTYIPKKLMIDLLFDFARCNRERINRLIFDKKFVFDPGCIREIANDFIHTVSNATMNLYINGEIDGGERTIHNIVWPYDEYDFPYREEDA